MNESARGSSIHEGHRSDFKAAASPNSSLVAAAWEWDVNSDSVVFDPEYAKILECSVEELPDSFSHWIKTLHPDDVLQATADTKAYATGAIDKLELKVRVVSKSSKVSWIWIWGTSTTKDNNGKIKRITGIIVDIDRFSNNEMELIKRIQYEKDLAMCSKVLLQMDTPYEKTINEALKHLLNSSGADSVTIFENFDSIEQGLCMRLAYEVNSQDSKVLGESQLLEQLPYENGFERWYSELPQGFTIKGPVDDFPLTERETMTSYGFKSILVIPLRVRREWFGFISFNEFNNPREWTNDDSRMLRTAADLFGAFIERIQAEEILRASESRFRSIVDLTRDAVFLVDSDDQILRMNNRCLKMFDYNAEELISLPLNKLVKTFETGFVDEDPSLVRFLASTGNVVEAEGIRKDGQIFDIEVNCVMIKEGDIPRYWIFIRDVTLRKKQEKERLELLEQVLHAQRYESLGVLAGGLAHEFNNILAAIMGQTELGLTEVEPDNVLFETLTAIAKSANRAANLNKQMLAYSGQGKYFVNRLNLSDEVEEIMELIGVSLPDNVRVELKLDFKIPPIFADQAQFQQIFNNLMNNATESIYADREGVITIKTGKTELTLPDLQKIFCFESTKPGQYVYMQIEDNGRGMDEDTMGRAFDPFFTTNFIGRGLGLPAVLGILRSHQGAIKITSEQNEGTIVTVYFPVNGKKKPD